MWSRFGKALGLFGPAAPETEPIVPAESSTAASPPPPPDSPTYSPPPSPVRNVVPPDAPELRPCPPSVQWMAKVSAMQTSGMPYDNEIFACGIVGYYRPPRWLADFNAKWLSTFVPAWKLDLPRPPDAPKRFHYEWCQRALKELFTANQMLESTYHAALIELSRLGRDVVDDPAVAAICNAEAETYAHQGTSNWGSADSAAWRSGRDTRSTRSAVVDLWAPHPGPAPAEGQPVSVVVAEGVAPGWGSRHSISSTPILSAQQDAQDERDRQRLLDAECERRERREKAEYVRERDAARHSRRSHSEKWSQSNKWAHAHAHRNSSARDPRAQTPQSRSGGKRKHDEDSEDDRASVRSQSASRHEPQRSLQRNQSDHFSHGGKGTQPARGKGRYERAEAYFTEQGSVSDATDAQASHHSRWYSSDKPPRRPPHPSHRGPASYSQTEAKAREALYHDRAQAEADEEAARESAQLAQRHAKGPPQPPRSAPARPEDSRQFPNFSNDTPPLYNRSDATSKDAVRADRARTEADEEAACEHARLARMQDKVPPRQPCSTPIRPEDSTLKPAPPFTMPATPTPIPMQQLTTPTQAATRQAISLSYQNEKGLWIYPPPHTLRPSPPPLPSRPPGTPAPGYREVAEFEACMEQASDTMSLEELAASTDFSTEQKGILFQMILAKKGAHVQRLPSATRRRETGMTHRGTKKCWPPLALKPQMMPRRCSKTERTLGHSNAARRRRRF